MLKSTLLAAGMALAALPAVAGIVHFEIDQTFIQGKYKSDIPAVHVPIGSLTNFTVDPGFSGKYMDFQFPGSGTFATVDEQVHGYYFLRSYADGDKIGSDTFSRHLSVNGDWDTVLVAKETRGVWDNTHNGFLAFQTDAGNFGWIEYSYIRYNGVSTLNLLSGAYEMDAHKHIMIGKSGPGVEPIPLPFSAAFLVAGMAGLGLVRRKKADG